ncbi:hypothetical protein A5657_08660 [Mycobacterium kubicae]|nr:hypothetical protein A5657_08660 [Mycobacterium kubicae]
MLAVVLSYEAFDEAGRRTRGDDSSRTPEELAAHLAATGYRHAFIRSEGRLVAGIDPAGAWANPHLRSRAAEEVVNQRVDDGGQEPKRPGRIGSEVRADIERVRSTRGEGAGAASIEAARQEAQQREARRQQVRDRQRRDRGRER